MRESGEVGAKTKRCLRCDAPFGCGAESTDKPCWCTELPPVMPVSDAGCLCPKCLREEIEELIRQAGLCASCGHAKRMKTKGQSLIYLCGLAAGDPAFPKYPRLPMAACPGHRTS